MCSLPFEEKDSLSFRKEHRFKNIKRGKLNSFYVKVKSTKLPLKIYLSKSFPELKLYLVKVEAIKEFALQ